MDDNLTKWTRLYETARNAHEDNLAQYQKNQKQYDGTLQPDKGKEVTCFYNFTEELIESSIDNGVPQPKIEPLIPNDKNNALARGIENMIIGEMKRINFEPINDQDERTTKIAGGNTGIVEWDNNIKTHFTTGALDFRLISPMQFIPQQGVYEKKYMDYFFLTFEDTKKRIEKRYNKNVEFETVDTTMIEQPLEDDLVTQVWCYYRNKNGGIGVFSFVGKTILIDDDNYNARGKQVCAACGRTKDGPQCECGSRKFVKRNLEYEELTEDKKTQFGVIPAKSYARNDDGSYKLMDIEVPKTELNPITGQLEPLYEQVFDDVMNPIGETMQTRTEQQAYMEPTKIPYYVPNNYPVSIRRNVSAEKNIYGRSDAQDIFELQDKANKVATRMIDKVFQGGRLLTKPKGLNLTFTNGLQVVELETIDQKQQIDLKDLSFNAQSDLNVMTECYMMAKSLLGINDSSQGKQDTTATSGKAKEAQISRALGRQESKVKMKNAFYQDIFKTMFQYMLAYADEPRSYNSQNDEGDNVESVFNRYDFLEQDDKGQWYWNDQFIFTVDTQGGAQDNRQYIIETMDKDFQAGLYGDPSDPETMYNLWKDREALQYPNAKRQVARWAKKVQEYKNMQAQMQQQQAIQQQMMGGVQNEMQQM